MNLLNFEMSCFLDCRYHLQDRQVGLLRRMLQFLSTKVNKDTVHACIVVVVVVFIFTLWGQVE